MSPHPPATVLFVDDDPVSRNALGYVFRNAGFRVLEAGTGAEALRLAEGKPEVVVLDVNLPDINGFEVCRRIKSHPATRSVSVVHMSGHYVKSGDRTQALEGGADGYLVKPVEARELLATVRSLLRIREAEEASREAERQWRITFDAISDAVLLLDAGGKVVRCNRAAGELLGRPADALVGRAAGEAVREGLALRETSDLFLGGPGGGRQTREIRLGSRWFHVTADPVPEPGESGVAHVLILTDITWHKDLEEQLRQGQKMEAIGRLAGGVAHDFNNLLTAVLGNASLLLRATPADRPEHELVATIERAAWRAAELTRQLLGFSRQTVLWLKPVSLNDAVGEVVAMLERTIDPRVTLQVRRAEKLWLVNADSGQMAQVLMNLCLNARDAMPDGGTLTLETSEEEVDAAHAEGHLEARPGQFVRLRVADTGTGIPRELMPRIFDPFFTTKPPGKGTGLGLAMVFGIIKQHQGWVECHSDPGRGTRFDIYLPRLEGGSVPAAPAPAPAAARGGTETVLLADDNLMLRNLASAVLRSHGFQVVLAEDGQEAVEMYQRLQGQIDLVVLDLMMPRLSGQEALKRLRSIDPSVRVVLASGFSDAQLSQQERAQIQGFVSKPYRERDLVQAVRAALDAATDAPSGSTTASPGGG